MDPNVFNNVHEAYISSTQLLTEVEEEKEDQLVTFLQYFQSVKKEKFSILEDQLGVLADLYIAADEDEETAESAQSTSLADMLKEPRNQKIISKNVLTEDQIMQSLENLVRQNMKFQIHDEETEFDLDGSIQKIYQRAKIIIENIRTIKTSKQRIEENSDESSFDTDSDMEIDND